MKLDVREVQPGDWVEIRHGKNFLEGEACHLELDWYIEAFKSKIIFARDRQNGLGARMVPTIHLAGHTSQLTNESG